MAGDSPGLSADLTIAHAARAVGLSRTTLMYYERLGLIRPQRRAGSRYRRFGAEDLQKLFLITRWRAAGLPLQTIRHLLQDREAAPEALRDHLQTLDKAIDALRGQRRLTLELLGRSPSGATAAPLNKAAWTAMFRAIGMTDGQMREWHAAFEQRNGEAHRAFLRSLGLDNAEIGRIRAWCRRMADGEGVNRRRRRPRA